MAVPKSRRCTARDHGRQCQRKKIKRDMCRKHYERWRRSGGETRTQREIKALAAKAAWRQRDIDLARAIGEKVVDPIFGPFVKDNEGDGSK